MTLLERCVLFSIWGFLAGQSLASSLEKRVVCAHRFAFEEITQEEGKYIMRYVDLKKGDRIPLEIRPGTNVMTIQWVFEPKESK